MKKYSVLRVASLTYLLLTAISLSAAPLKIGDPIPNATLTTEKGEPVELRKLVAKQPTALIFYRGGWCPYCTRHLAALADVHDDLTAAGYQIIAISPDQPSKIAETPDREKLTYTLLSDSALTTSDAFGLSFQVPADLVAKYKNEYQIDLEAASGQTHHRLPHPAVFLVNPDGTISFAYVNEDYRTRLEPAEILKAANAPKD